MKKSRTDIRRGVKSRIRKKVSGTTERPRLAVFRSLNHIYAQVIDDENGKTLAAASTTEKDLTGKSGGNLEAAQTVGKAIAERALSAGVSQVVFDRGGYVYHGRVKALIDATREAGLNKNQNNASEEDSADKSTLDTVATTVGNVVGTVAGMIGNLVGGSAETPAKKSGGKRAKKTDEPQAQTDKVKEEKNENE
ncbi:MAG: 50S ribosomal protein L18 [Acidobacteria bacterium]|jgi:large subunit ribosomal protein L18|nr:50S ribosomal protein L18 [Acidobacteriota bacterium]